MFKWIRNKIDKLKCQHEYTLLCTGENSFGSYHFCKCKKCGKNKIDGVNK